VRRCKTKHEAAQALLADLNEMGATETPDGYRYTVTTLRAALVGI
jgi:hypothetical protein